MMAKAHKWKLVGTGACLLTFLILTTIIPVLDCYPCWDYLITHKSVSPSERGPITHTCVQMLNCRLSKRTWMERRMRANNPWFYEAAEK